MKVKDLIKKLGDFDPERTVLVSGYEGGYESGIKIEEKEVEKHKYPTYYGDYDGFSEWSEGSLPLFTAVVIERDSDFRGEEDESKG